jgi:hypothetical protein
MIMYWATAAIMGVLSALIYWILHWHFHRGKLGNWRTYMGFKGWLRWGWKARWNMAVLFLAIMVMNWVTMPKDLI